MSIVPILQSIAQAKALFPQDKWEIFIENCAVLVYMGSGPAAKTTHKFISELIGEMTKVREKFNDTRSCQKNEQKELYSVY